MAISELLDVAPAAKVAPRVALLTGLRPTGSLTLANVVGAVQPLLRRQQLEQQPILLFVADLHALTDNEPAAVAGQVRATVADLLALGIDTSRIRLFVQSAVLDDVNELAGYLARLVRVSELLRQPSLKDKLRAGQGAEQASAALLMYPVLMAADILLHGAAVVPVGEDQLAHLELARLLARRFNAAHGPTLVEPRALTGPALRILALRGEKKMSKSDPETALLLDDDAATANRKIAGCQTAVEGRMSPHLASHLQLIESLDPEAAGEATAIVAGHLRGERVMGRFKQHFARVVTDYLARVQSRRARLTSGDIDRVLAEGRAFARGSARRTLGEARQAMRFRADVPRTEA
jgi:tryptophanyl-tRNA synthetase